MALTELERDRLKRIEQNKRRMAEMVGPMEQYDALMPQAAAAPPKKREKRPPAPRLVLSEEDKRRSGRIKALPAPNYNEVAADRALRCAMPQPEKKAKRAAKRAGGRGGRGKGGWREALGDASLAAAEAATAAAVKLAGELEAKGRVVAVKLMSYSQVAPGFWMGVPSALHARMGIKATATIELVSDAAPVLMDGSSPPLRRAVSPGVWRVQYHFKTGGSSGIGLSGGWAGFSKDQWLFPSDTLVYEKEGPTRLRAHVFRGADYETDETAAQGVPARVLSVRGLRPTAALAAALAAGTAGCVVEEAEEGEEGDEEDGGSGVEENEAEAEGEEQEEEQEEGEEEEGDDAGGGAARRRAASRDQGAAGGGGGGSKRKKGAAGAAAGGGAAKRQKASAAAGGGGKIGGGAKGGGKAAGGVGDAKGGGGRDQGKKAQQGKAARSKAAGAGAKQQAEADRRWDAGEEVFVLPKRLPAPTAEEIANNKADASYAVKSIKGYRLEGGERQLLVHWLGFSDTWNTWEPITNLDAPPANYHWVLPMPSAVRGFK